MFASVVCIRTSDALMLCLLQHWREDEHVTAQPPAVLSLFRTVPYFEGV